MVSSEQSTKAARETPFKPNYIVINLIKGPETTDSASTIVIPTVSDAMAEYH